MTLIASVKQKVSILDVLQKYTRANLSRIRNRTKILIRCPLHDDRSPSFTFNRETNHWRCYAGCGHGDVINLVSIALNISNRDAVNKLAFDFGINENKLSKIDKLKLIEQEKKKNIRQALIQDYNFRYEKAFKRLIALERLCEKFTSNPSIEERDLCWLSNFYQHLPYVTYLLDELIFISPDIEEQTTLRASAVIEAEKFFWRLDNESS
jgi:DNA primase